MEIHHLFIFLCENSLFIITEDITYSNKLNFMEFSQINTSYYYSIYTEIMLLDFKNYGASNIQICDIIVNVLYLKLLKVKVIKEKLFEKTQKTILLNQVTYTEYLYIFSYALSIITTGNGDLNHLKSFVSYEKVDSLDYKHFITGYNQTINHSIDILFLESRDLIFNYNRNIHGIIYISTFPLFDKNLNVNEKYSQALRNKYVLVCENIIFDAKKDIKTNDAIRNNVNIKYFNGSVSMFVCLLT